MVVTGPRTILSRTRDSSRHLPATMVSTKRSGPQLAQVPLRCQEISMPSHLIGGRNTQSVALMARRTGASRSTDTLSRCA